jgi:hypothetical protein
VGQDIAVSNANGNASDADSAVHVPVASGSVEVMPRSTSARSGQDESRSSAHSDLVTANVPNLVAMEVLSGDAEAVWTPSRSTSRSQADVAKLTLGNGDVVIVLMHAEGSSDGRGRLYLIRINDAVLFDSQDERTMTLEVPDIFTIEIGGTSARAGRFTGEVVEVAWLDNTALSQFAAAVDAAGGPSVPTARSASNLVAAESSNVAGDQPLLPLSGAPIALIVSVALALIALGAAMSFTARVLAPR